jgi:hypothetical protein
VTKTVSVFNLDFSNSLLVDNDQPSFMNRRMAPLFEYFEGTSKAMLNSEEGMHSNDKKLPPRNPAGMSMNQFVHSLFAAQPQNKAKGSNS